MPHISRLGLELINTNRQTSKSPSERIRKHKSSNPDNLQVAMATLQPNSTEQNQNRTVFLFLLKQAQADEGA